MLVSLPEFNLPFISLALQDYFCPNPKHFTVYNQKQYLVLYIIMNHTAVNFHTNNKKSRHDIMVWEAKWGDRKIGLYVFIIM